MPRRFSPHDPGHFVPLRRTEEAANEDRERAKLGIHGLHDDDAPAASTPVHAEWCDEEEDRCSSRPQYQGRRMSQERPETSPDEELAEKKYPQQEELRCTGDGKGSSDSTESKDAEKSCPRVGSDPLW